jgi:transmembrane sensor
MEPNAAQRLRIAEQAAEWVALLPTADFAQKQACFAWLKISPLHVAEFLRAEQVNRSLDRYSQARFFANDEDRSQAVPKARSATRSKRIAGLMAASVAALGLAALLATGIRAFDTTMRSDAGEWRSEVLSDGSSLEIGPRSQVRVDFEEHARVVRLTNGDAWFDVASDPARPFIVRTDCCSVRARGTQFSVSLREHGILVTVAEGSVVVSQTSPARAVVVAANEQLRVTADADWTPRPVATSRALSWTRRVLVFQDTTVGDAIREFNRLNQLQLQLPDQSLAGRQIRGSFAADDPRAFAYMLERTQGLVAVDGDRVLLLLAQARSDGASEARRGGRDER